MKKIKINYISDIHLDFWIPSDVLSNEAKMIKEIKTFVDMILPQKEDIGDVLIIGGDLTHYNKQLEYLFTELKKYWDNILVTWGNHDLYFVSNNIARKYKENSFNRIKEQKEICDNFNINYLDGDVIEIQGIKFGGTGNWYMLDSDGIDLWHKYMNDSRLIAEKVIHTQQMYSYGTSTKNYVFNSNRLAKKEKEKLQDISNNGVDVLITHIGMNEPSLDEGMAEVYIGDEANIFYYTDDFDIVKKSGAKLHIHGHTHQFLKYNKDGVDVLCNPLGYPSDNNYSVIETFDLVI